MLSATCTGSKPAAPKDAERAAGGQYPPLARLPRVSTPAATTPPALNSLPEPISATPSERPPDRSCCVFCFCLGCFGLFRGCHDATSGCRPVDHTLVHPRRLGQNRGHQQYEAHFSLKFAKEFKQQPGISYTMPPQETIRWRTFCPTKEAPPSQKTGLQVLVFGCLPILARHEVV